MSHAVVLETALPASELDAFEQAAARRGLRLVRNVERFKSWYTETGETQFRGDSPMSAQLLRAGVTTEQWSRCTHKLVVDAESRGEYEYEIGLVDKGDGTFELRYDAYGAGQRLTTLGGGEQLDKLWEEHGYAIAESQAYADGYSVDRQLEADGSITLVACRG